MTSPTNFWVPSIATSGLMIYSGDKFPMWVGDIFSGALAGEQLARVHLDDDIEVLSWRKPWPMTWAVFVT